MFLKREFYYFDIPMTVRLMFDFWQKNPAYISCRVLDLLQKGEIRGHFKAKKVHLLKNVIVVVLFTYPCE